MIIRSSGYKSGPGLNPPPVPQWARAVTEQPRVVIREAEPPPALSADRHVHRVLQRLLNESARAGRLTLEAFQNICERRGLTTDETHSVEALLNAKNVVVERPKEIIGWLPPDDEDGTGWEASPFDIYMQDLGRFGLLSREDEVGLGRRIRVGRQCLPVVFEHNRLIEEEIEERTRSLIKGATADLQIPDHLRSNVEDGSKAEERMFCCNLRLVISIARKTYWSHSGMEPLDLIQGGNTGLARAVIKFDHMLGYKFSTYATAWIQQAITRHVANTGRIIRLPVHVHDEIRKIRAAKRELERELQQEPTLQDIAEFTRIDAGKIAFLEHAAHDCLSLDKPLVDGSASLKDLYIGPDNVAQAIEHHANVEFVSEILGGLAERDAMILRMRFGIGTEDPKTLEQIGQVLGLTRERIRQLEKKALKRLAANPDVRDFSGRVLTPSTNDDGPNAAKDEADD